MRSNEEDDEKNYVNYVARNYVAKQLGHEIPADCSCDYLGDKEINAQAKQ